MVSSKTKVSEVTHLVHLESPIGEPARYVPPITLFLPKAAKYLTAFCKFWKVAVKTCVTVSLLDHGCFVRKADFQLSSDQTSLITIAK